MILECALCQAHVETYRVGGYVRRLPEGGEEQISLYQCARCNNPILLQQANIGNLAVGDVWDDPSILHPPPDFRVNPKAPKDIQAAFSEAFTCYRSKAYTAAAIMCRKTLEGICLAHGAAERNLAASLKKMRDEGLIDQQLFEWSDALRLAGNEAAHGVAISIAAPDARDILEFTNAILDYLFSYRDRFNQFRRRRAAVRRQ